MVFRKPYAFLIKHFRLIHLIMTALLVYTVRFSNKIYSFINSCIKDQVNRYNALDFIDYNVYIYIGIAILLFGVIFWLFKYKDKPRNVYMISILGYIVICVYLFVVFGYFNELPSSIMDQKVIRAYRDITLIVLGFQYIIIIIMFLRGLGFDVKKFNFTKDIQELNITNEDGEEVEVDLSVNTSVVLRGVRKKKRELGYFFQEYKIIILGIFAIILFTVGYFGYNYCKKVFKVYNQGEWVGVTNYVSVQKSYFNIGSDSNYIIVNFDIFKYGIEDKFNVSNLVLSVDGEKYFPNKNICNSFNNLGTCYKKQYVNKDKTSYIVVYEVDNLNLDKTYLIYKETYDDSYKFKLNLESYE